jgi:hypothetical protein
VTCRHSFGLEKPFKYQNIAKGAPHYKIVDKCICSNETRKMFGMDCKEDFQDMEFAPVFSHSSGTIYSNVRYAECYNDLETIPWLKSIVCAPDVEPSMPDHSDVGNNLTASENGCLFYYIPPKELDLDTIMCFPDVIRKCNTTRTMKRREPFWDFCEKFNATYTVQTFRNLKAYANIYCFMCNTLVDIDNIKEMQCSKQSSGKEKVFHMVSLTIILDYENDDEMSYPEHNDKERQTCPEDTLLIASFKVSI